MGINRLRNWAVRLRLSRITVTGYRSGSSLCRASSASYSWRWHSQNACERNASIEGVGERVAFRKASVSKLPFDDGAFDAVVSNLTFREVRDTADKRAVIKEALGCSSQAEPLPFGTCS
jgi:hypothetical protein